MERPILLIVYPNQFGYHTDTYKYCEYLKEKYEVSYFCFDQGYEKIEMPGINIFYFPYKINKVKRLYNYIKFVIKYSYVTSPSVIFVVQFKFSLLLGIFCKAYVKVLDYRTGVLTNNAIKRKVLNFAIWFDSLFFKNISVISEGLRKELSLKKNSLILPLGSDPISIISHSYNVINLLYVGTLDNRNIHETVQGVAIFLDNNPLYKQSLTYTIIGFGRPAVEENLTNTIRFYNLQNIIFFLGKKKFTELSTYFDQCNIGVSYIPIKQYYQIQPATKTFEYAMSGLYTIATNTIENKNVINKENGILCNDTPEDFALALQKVIDNITHINEISIRESLKEYTWKNIVGKKLVPYLSNKLK